MRIHGAKKLSRRAVQPQNNYRKYLTTLQEDFHFICGYCGKHQKLSTKGFEIDHFICQDEDPSKTNDYNNLVYSCFTCNRKKGKKKSALNTGEILIDPASSDYDLHLSRNDSGKIDYLSPSGKYMSEDVFKFHIRPIDVIWKMMVILEKKEALAQKIMTLSEDQLKQYAQLDLALINFQNYILQNKE